MFKPLFAGVKQVLKTKARRGHHLPRHRHRRLGSGDLQHALAGRQDPRLPPRHVLPPLDRHVQAARPRRRSSSTPPGAPAPRPPSSRRALEADKNHEIKAVLVTHNETATGVRSDVAAVRKAMDAAKHPALLLVDGVSSIGSHGLPHGRVGRRRRRHRQPEGLHAPDRPRHRRRQPEGARRRWRPRSCRAASSTSATCSTPTRRAASPTPRRCNLFYGLGESLKMLEEEGLEQRLRPPPPPRRGHPPRRRRLGPQALRPVARSLLRDGQRHLRPRGLRQHQARRPRRRQVRRRLRRRPRRGRRQGLPHRPPRLARPTSWRSPASPAPRWSWPTSTYPITLGSGVAAAQEYYRGTAAALEKAA